MTPHIIGGVMSGALLLFGWGLMQHMNKDAAEMERCQVLGHSAEGLRHLRLVMLEELADGGGDWLRQQIEWVDREAETTQKLAGCW